MRSIRLLIPVLGVCGAAVIVCGQDEEPSWPARQLKFESRQEPLRGAHFPRVSEKMRFEARFQVSAGNFQIPDRNRLLKTRAAAAVSPEQREYLQDERLTRGMFPTIGYATPAIQIPASQDANNPTVWHQPSDCVVFGATEADARLMAQAVIEAGDRQRWESLRSAEKEIASLERRLNEAPDQLARTEEEIPRLKAIIEQAKAVFPYETEEQAAQDVRELDKTLRSIDVDITGMQARTKAIEQFRTDPRVRDDETRALLDRLQIEEDINLMGATARRASVEAQRKNAEAYRDASVALAKAEAQQKMLKSDIKSLPGTLMVKKGELAQRNDLKPLDVIDNTIVIRPVR